MFHIIAHMSYHFQTGGCGIKPFIDLYLLEQKLDYDKNKLMDFCKRAGVDKFYDCVRQVIDVWFSEAPHTEVTRRIEDSAMSGVRKSAVCWMMLGCNAVCERKMCVNNVSSMEFSGKPFFQNEYTLD